MGATGAGFSTLARELDTQGWIEVFRQASGARAQRAVSQRIPIPSAVPVTDRNPDNLSPKTKRAGSRLSPFPTLFINYIIAHFSDFVHSYNLTNRLLYSVA